MEEIKNTIDKLGSAFEDFKKQNDERLKQIESKGSSDAVTVDQVNKLNDLLDAYKGRVDKLEASANAALEEQKQEEGQNIAYKKAFNKFLRKGDRHLGAEEMKALSVNSDQDGGYTVTPEMSNKIITRIFESNPMRQISAVETISTESLEFIEDYNEAGSGWVGETTTITETTTPGIGLKNIPTHELYAEPRATQKLVDDSSIDMEDWLQRKVGKKFARDEATAFINGTGDSQPRGILTYTSGTSWGEIEQVNSGTSGAVTADGLIDLLYALKEEHMINASFLANRLVVRDIRKLKGEGNEYLWQPSFQAGQPDTVLGKQIRMATDMPVAAADSLSVACGDFQECYQIVDRIGIRVQVDPYTAKPFIKYYTTKRVGGDVTNFDAIKIQKLAS